MLALTADCSGIEPTCKPSALSLQLLVLALKADSRKLMALSEEAQHPCNPPSALEKFSRSASHWLTPRFAKKMNPLHNVARVSRSIARPVFSWLAC
jgi:hypothetical protein